MTKRQEDFIQSVLRSTDVAQEPLELHLPIGGYEKMPLVSLEEAVQKLVHLLPAVQSLAFIAKQRCKEPADGLSPDESASIMLYTMGWQPLNECLYVVLNAALRSADRHKLEPWFLYLRLILTGLSRLPPFRASVYRGVKGDLRKNYIVGETIVWWGFSSCTIDVTVLESELFLGKTGTRTIFTIACNSARDIRHHSYYASENEVLLLPATQFKVTGCLNQGDLHIIQLKETQPPFALLQPVPVHPHPFNPFSAGSTFSESKSVHSSKESSSLAGKSSTILPPSPKYRNGKLEKVIAENKVKSELDLSRKSLTDEDMEIVADYVLQNNKTLTELNLNGNQIGVEGAQHLGEVLRHNTTLESLNLLENQIGAKGAQHLAEALQQNMTLTNLNLGANKIEADGAEHLAEALQHNRTLTTLYLHKNQIGDKGTQHIAAALRQNTTLTTLSLYDNQIGAQGAQYLADVLEHNKTLTVLYLIENRIGDKGAQYLAKSLRQNTTLVILILSQNKIGDNGMNALCETLEQYNRTLKKIWVDNNNITDRSAEAILAVFAMNHILDEFTFSDTNQFSKEVLLTLQTTWYKREGMLKSHSYLDEVDVVCLELGNTKEKRLSRDASFIFTNFLRFLNAEAFEHFTKIQMNHTTYLILCCEDDLTIRMIASFCLTRKILLYVLRTENHNADQNINIFNSEEPMIFRLTTRIVSQYRALGDEAIEMGKKEKARTYFQHGVDMQQKLVTYLKKRQINRS